MKKEELSAAMSDIEIRFIAEAENYDMSKRKFIKRPLSRIAVAAIVIGCLVFTGVAYAGTTLTDFPSPGTKSCGSPEGWRCQGPSTGR